MSQTNLDVTSIDSVATQPANEDNARQNIETNGSPFGQSSDIESQNHAVNLDFEDEIWNAPESCQFVEVDPKEKLGDALRKFSGQEWTGREHPSAIGEMSTWKRCKDSDGRSCLLGFMDTSLGNKYILIIVDWQWLHLESIVVSKTKFSSVDAVSSQLKLEIIGDAHFGDLACLTKEVGNSSSFYLKDCELRIVAIANILANHSMLNSGTSSKEVIKLATDKLCEMKDRVKSKNLKMTHRIGKAEDWTGAWEDFIEISYKLTLLIIPALVSGTKEGVMVGEAKFADIRKFFYDGIEPEGELPEDEVLLTNWTPKLQAQLEIYRSMYIHHATLMVCDGRLHLKLELAQQLLETEDNLVPNPLEGSDWFSKIVYKTESTTADVLARTALVLGAGHCLRQDKIKEKQDELIELCKDVKWWGKLEEQKKKPDCDVEMYLRTITHAGTESRSTWAFISSIFLDPATQNKQNTGPARSSEERTGGLHRFEGMNLRPRDCWNRIRFPFGSITPPFNKIIVAGEKTLLYFVPPIITLAIAVLVALVMCILLWREEWNTVEKLTSALTTVLVFVLTIGGFFHKFVYPAWDIPFALSWRLPIEIAYSYAREEDQMAIAKEIIKLGRANEVFANQNTSFLGNRTIFGNLILRKPLRISDLLSCEYESGVSAGKEALCRGSLLLIDNGRYRGGTVQYEYSRCLVSPRKPIDPEKKVI